VVEAVHQALAMIVELAECEEEEDEEDEGTWH